MKILVIYNPRAGGGRARRLLPAIRRALAEKGIDAEFALTQARGHGATLAEQTDLTSFDALVVAGGDGTLFEVLNGYLRNPGAHKPALGMIPNGTGNAFMKELGLRSSDWRKAIDIIELNQARSIDVGQLQAQGRTWYFLNIVGMGFIADIAATAARLKWLGNSAYTLAVLLRLPWLRAQKLSLEIDGRNVEREGVFVEVANSSYTGTSFLIAPKARLDDGLLDVVLLKRISRIGLLRLFRTVYDGSHIHNAQVEYLQVRSIAVTEPVPGQLVPDGEILGRSPARFECLPGALRFLWPQLSSLLCLALALLASPILARADDAPGYSQAFTYSGEVLGNVHGGIDRGAAYAGLGQLTLEWADTDWLAHTDFYMPHGDSLNGRYVGAISDVSNINAVHQLRVHELWAQRSYGRMSLRAGLLAADTEFWGADTANLFVNSVFGAPSVVSGNLPGSPIFPQGVLGARVALALGDDAALRLAVLDGDGGDLAGDNRHGLHVSLGQGALLLAEYQRGFHSAGGGGTQLRLAAFFHTGDFTGTQGETVRGNCGFVGSIDHAVAERLSVFVRAGFAPQDRSAIPWSIETGLDWSSVFTTGDKLGIGFGYIDLNGSPALTGTMAPLRHEAILEGTLDLPLGEKLDLQPDLQYIIDPGGAATARNALVVGLRVNARL